MTSLPPELAHARELLRQVAPQSGSKERIYWRVTAKRLRRDKPGGRFAIVAVCLCVSATAMGLGYRMVTREKQAQSPAVAVTREPHPLSPVPRRQNSRQVPRQDQDEPEADSNRTEQPQNTPLRKAVAVPAPGASMNGASEAPRKSIASLPDLPELSTQSEPPAVSSELGQQLADYRQAVALLPNNPAAALQRLNMHRAKWPSGAIAHEVDLRVIEALVSLGRRAEAADSARQFLRRHPDSARAAEVRHIAELMPSAGAGVD
jgi:TolA-binding protein